MASKRLGKRRTDVALKVFPKGLGRRGDPLLNHADLSVRRGMGGFVATSSSMLAVLERIEQVAGFDVAIHVRGESGTGKELVARAIHERGERSGSPFVAINCAAIPDSLLEAELFGHVRGAFTGAERSRLGLVEEAHGGTLFLDEVADLSMRGQSLLLRVLQEREFRRLGESSTQRADFRLLSATHKRLENAVKEGTFREDLFFRLKVVDIEIPALRNRRDDILPLVEYFLTKKSAQLRLARPLAAKGAKNALVAYSWPGNVRELENEIVQSLLRLGQSKILELKHLSSNIRGRKSSTLRFASSDFEKQYLEDALARHGGNRTRTARFLGLTRQALYNKLKKHRLLISVGKAS